VTRRIEPVYLYISSGHGLCLRLFHEPLFAYLNPRLQILELSAQMARSKTVQAALSEALVGF
jgi:hypothetical protein